MTKKIRNSLLGVFSLAAMTTMCLSVAFSSKLTVKAEESNVFEMVYGAGIRVSDPTGMRFKTKFSENYYTELTTEDTDTQLFVSIFPYADYINYDISGQDLMPWLDSYYGAGKYINIAMDPTKFYQEANDDCYYANAVISNINFNNYYREFVGVAYLRRGTADNYTYEYTTKAITKEDNARSVFEVATKANMDEEDRENHGEALEVFIKNGLYGAYGVKYDKNTNTYSLNGNTYTTIEDVEEVVQLDGATLSLDNAALTIGESKQLTPTLTYADGTVFTKDAICIWNSSNPSVATVDENGTVTAISEGETTITLTACGGLYTATATISVSKVEPIGVVIEETLYDSTGEFKGSATTEVAAPEGFENVHKYVGTGEYIHGANYSAKCLSDYSFVTFAIKTPKMLIGNGGWIETEDWLVFELTQTSEAVWTITVLKNGEVLHTAENMSGNRDGGAYVYNALDSILYGVPAPEYYVGSVNNVLTAYFTEVRGISTVEEPEKPEVELIGVVIEETLYDSTGEFAGSATTEVAAPEGFENVHKFVGTGENIHGANYSAKCLSDYSFVTFAIKTPKMLIGNGGWIETEDWLVFELTQTSEAVWTITVLKNGEVLHTAENMSGNRDGGAYVYNALDSILYGVPSPEYYVGSVNNELSAYFTEVRGILK